MKGMLVALALLSGCFIKPDRVAGGDGGGGSGDGGGSGFHDARPDSEPSMFIPKLAATAHFNKNGDAINSDMMDDETFALKSDKVSAGDLVLLIGSVDNQPQITDPPGFTRLIKAPYGDGETQTYVAYWKIATASEPAYYIGKYPNNHMTGDSSAAGAYVLLTVGLARDTPAIASQHDCVPTCDYETVMAAPSQGVATTVANSIVIYAAGGNWLMSNGLDAYTMATDFTQLAAFGDYGDNRFNWSDVMVGWQPVPIIRSATPATGTITSNQTNFMSTGSYWSLEIAVAPQ